MKRDRQAVIKQMISRDKIGTQEEIKQRLEAEGITDVYKRQASHFTKPYF